MTRGKAGFLRLSANKPSLVALAFAVAGCQPSSNNTIQSGGAYHPIAGFFTPAQAWMGRSLYAHRVAEQADPDGYAVAAQRLRFKLESRAIHFSYIGSDDPLAPRSEWAVPMGIVNGGLAVLTSRCMIDYKYPLREGQPDPRFRNLAIFDADGRAPRTVFMLAPVAERPELSDARDPRGAHLLFDNRFYLNGPAGDRYFGVLASGRLPRVGVQLVQGDWRTSDGIDLAMLYFPLSDPDVVSALRPSESLGIQDPMGVVQAAMQGRTEYLQTFSFDMITAQCLHAAEAELQHAEHEARLWRGIALVAAAAAVLPLLGPTAFASEGGLAGFAGHMASAMEQAVGPKILSGMAPAAWRVAQRALSGQQLADVLWDEGGHLIMNAVVDGVPRRLSVAGIRRGTADNETAARVLATAREFVRDRAGQLLVQSAIGHADVASLMRPDFGVDLTTELLASGLAALDTDDRPVLARQPTLLRAAAFALQGSRGPAVLDPRYQWAVQQLAALAGS
jgi:hypothetical protein